MVQQSSTNNSGSSALGERLQRRLIKPAGVINTQQLHRHYQGTKKMAGQLIQRLALQEQVNFRYGAGILQPTAMIERLQRQRRESSVSSQPFRDSGTKVPTKNRVNNPDSLLAKKPESQISSPLVQASQGGGENKSKSAGHRQVRINRQATLSEVNSLANNPSHSVQMQVETDSPINPPVIQTQRETRSASLSPSPATSGTFRVSRQAKNNQDLPVVQTTSQVSPNTVQLKADTSVPANNLGTGGVGWVEERNPTPSHLLNRVENPDRLTQELPLTQTTHQLSPNTVKLKADTSVPANNLGTGADNYSTLQLAIQGNSTVSSQRLSASGTKVPTTNSSVQRSPAGAVTPKPTATLASTTPTPLSDSSEFNQVWRKNTNPIEVSEGQSTQIADHQKIPLPLARTPINTQSAIAGQTNTVNHSTVQLAMQGNSTVSSQPLSASTNSAIDIPAIAEQVSRILARQLVVERERRGIGKWH